MRSGLRFGLRFGLGRWRRLSDRRRRWLDLFLGLLLLDRLIVTAAGHYGQNEPEYRDQSPNACLVSFKLSEKKGASESVRSTRTL